METQAPPLASEGVIQSKSAASRRSLFAGVPAALLAGAVAAPTLLAAAHPDAELIRLCAEFDALEIQHEAFFEGPTRIDDDEDRDVALEPIETAQKALLDRICHLPICTLDGARALASTYLLYIAKQADQLPTQYWDQRFERAIVRGLVGGRM